MTSEATYKEWYDKGVEILLKDGWTQEKINSLEDYQIMTLGEIELSNPDELIQESFEDDDDDEDDILNERIDLKNP